MDTKASIKNSFIKLYSLKDFLQISVSELCAMTPVARTTFYAYYDNIDSVRTEIEDELIGKSYDLLGDGSIELINIPGHCDGLFAVKVKNDEGKYVLLFSDGGYAKKSWEEMITSGIAADKQQQKQSLAWIREQSLDVNCIESLATHDSNIKPHIIEF